MKADGKIDIGAYNSFCKNLSEGCILYNLDSTNLWGEYLLVASISKVRLRNLLTYAVLLLGLKKTEGNYIPSNVRITLTPEYINNIPFLKYVGRCKFKLIPEIGNMDMNIGLETVYHNTDLWRYKEKLSIRKPKKHKYDANGQLVIKKTECGTIDNKSKL